MAIASPRISNPNSAISALRQLIATIRSDPQLIRPYEVEVPPPSLDMIKTTVSEELLSIEKVIREICGSVEISAAQLRLLCETLYINKITLHEDKFGIAGNVYLYILRELYPAPDDGADSSGVLTATSIAAHRNVHFALRGDLAAQRRLMQLYQELPQREVPAVKETERKILHHHIGQDLERIGKNDQRALARASTFLSDMIPILVPAVTTFSEVFEFQKRLSRYGGMAFATPEFKNIETYPDNAAIVYGNLQKLAEDQYASGNRIATLICLEHAARLEHFISELVSVQGSFGRARDSLVQFVHRFYPSRESALRAAFVASLSLKRAPIKLDLTFEAVAHQVPFDTQVLEYVEIVSGFVERSAVFVEDDFSYYRWSFQGARPESLSLVKLTPNCRKIDRQIANLRGFLVGDGTAEARAGAIMPEPSVMIANAQHAIDDETYKLEQVGQNLLGDLRCTDQRVVRSVVCPAGDIWRIPFDALSLHHRGVLSGHGILYADSTSAFVQAAASPLVSQSEAGLAIGGADFDHLQPTPAPVKLHGRYGPFAPLPASTEEIDIVSQLATGCRVLTGRDAVPANLLATEAPRLVHFATHFFHNDRTMHVAETQLMEGARIMILPAEDGDIVDAMILSGANTVNSDEGVFDAAGVLDPRLIALWNLHGTRLVFISACSSGLGAVISNFAPTGIRQRFIEAGARCVIATLWPIKDEAALLLCRTFYEAAFKGGARVSEALQQAKERVRQQFPDVRDWAPVVAYGDDVDQL